MSAEKRSFDGGCEVPLLVHTGTAYIHMICVYTTRLVTMFKAGSLDTNTRTCTIEHIIIL